MQLSLVIPAHDEALRIERTLRAYRESLGPDDEVIVVANHCSDATVAVARGVAATLPGIAVLDIAERVGKGGAVRAGFAAARGEWVGFADADLATPPEDLARVVAAAQRSGAAIGSRWLPASRVSGRTPGRGVASRLFAGLVRALLDLPFRDTQCGVKVFHRRFLPAYLAEARVTDLAFDVELLVLLRAAGATIEEVPTTWIAQPGSSTLGSFPAFVRHGARMAATLTRLAARRGRRAPPASGGEVR